MRSLYNLRSLLEVRHPTQVYLTEKYLQFFSFLRDWTENPRKQHKDNKWKLSQNITTLIIMTTKKRWLSREKFQKHWSQLSRSSPSDWKLTSKSAERALPCYKTEGKEQLGGWMVGFLVVCGFGGFFVCYKLTIENGWSVKKTHSHLDYKVL